MRDFPRLLAAGMLGMALLFVANALGMAWLGATEFASDAFYDGCAAILTLALPAFAGGLALGWLARARALPVSVGTFVALGLVSLVQTPWRVPLVSPHSAHSGAMHYFLHNPLVALAFGTAGAWLSSQFATGRFSLADREPITPAHLGD